MIMVLLLTGCSQKESGSPEAGKIVLDTGSVPTDEKQRDGLITTGQTSHEARVSGVFRRILPDTSFYFSDQHLITLKITDSVRMEEYFLDAHTMDSLTEGHTNRYMEALEIEKHLLKTNSGRVRKDSNGLHLKMQNGDWMLVTVDSLTDEVFNTFEFYFRDPGFYSVRTQWYEGNGYKLICDRTGKITNLFGRPYFSPNGIYMIAVNADVDAGFSNNGFQLFRISNGYPEMLGFYEPESWGPYMVKWIDDHRLVMKNETVVSDEETMSYLDFYGELTIRPE